MVSITDPDDPLTLVVIPGSDLILLKLRPLLKPTFLAQLIGSIL